MSMAGRRSTTRALREPPSRGFRRLLGDRIRLSSDTGRLTQEREQAVALLLERCPIGFRHRRAPADLHPPGILRNAVDAELVVKVGSAGQSSAPDVPDDRKSTRLNSSHTVISYAVF